MGSEPWEMGGTEAKKRGGSQGPPQENKRKWREAVMVVNSTVSYVSRNPKGISVLHLSMYIPRTNTCFIMLFNILSSPITPPNKQIETPAK